jgi:hypothetical protein
VSQQNKLFSVDLGSLAKLSTDVNDNFIISGLSKGKVGFLISGPDIGKSYFCLSLAYELSSSMTLLGLKSQSHPIKVLYWPVEDGAQSTAIRMISHIESFSESVRQEIKQNFSLWSDPNPLCTLRNGSEIQSSPSQRSELIETAKQYDLLIIDTLREAAGNAHEVDDDLVVKNILKDIAIQADIAVLVVHHLNKDTVKGKERITNVSGSGYSMAQANARLILSLEKKGAKLAYSQLKANFVSHQNKRQDILLDWSSSGFLFAPTYFSKPDKAPAKPVNVEHVDSDLELEDILNSEDVQELLNNRKIIEPVEPLEVSISEKLFSEESMKKRAEKEAEERLLSDADEELLKAFHAKSKKN